MGLGMGKLFILIVLIAFGGSSLMASFIGLTRMPQKTIPLIFGVLSLAVFGVAFYLMSIWG